MKTYVNVVVSFDTDGNIRPLKILWSDELTLEIDRIKDIRPAASLKAGGTGIRYTCLIRGQLRYLFYEQGVWFVEGRD